MNEIAYVNGQFVPLAEAVVSVEDRGYQFADGIYEVTKFYGRKPLRLNAHLERLQQSADAMRIPNVLSPDEWQPIIARLVELCDLPDDETQKHTLYQQVTRGAYPRNHAFPKSIVPAAVAYFRKAPVYTPEVRARGIALSAQPDERWSRCNIKSVCLLPAIWAKQSALDAGAFEALLIKGNTVTEGSATNVFCVRDGILYTHPKNGMILGGITRNLVLEAAERAGVKLREEAVTFNEFAAADEAFITSTTMNVMPATLLDGKPIGNGLVGPVTRQVAEAVDELIAREVGLTAIAV